MNDESCVRLRPQGRPHVWAYDLVQTRTRDVRGVRLLTVIGEYAREYLAIRAGRRIRYPDMIEVLSDLMTARGVPAHLRSSIEPEFTAGVVRERLGNAGGNDAVNGAGAP